MKKKFKKGTICKRIIVWDGYQAVKKRNKPKNYSESTTTIIALIIIVIITVMMLFFHSSWIETKREENYVLWTRGLNISYTGGRNLDWLESAPAPHQNASTAIRKGRTITETGHSGGMLGKRRPSLVLWFGPFQLASSRYAAQQSSCPRTLVLAMQAFS